MLLRSGFWDRVCHATQLMMLCGGVSTLVQFSACGATSVTLVWSPSAGTNIAGYKIYYGPASRSYTNTVDVGNQTNAVVGNLVGGATYFFAATAYDTSALESDYSAEVAYTNTAVVAPTIVLTAPPTGANYTAPATIDLAASVTPNSHTITKVQFFNGVALLGEDTTAPYSYSWTNVGAGTYSLMAQAVYDSGSTVASSSANITVVASRPENYPVAISAIANQTITTNRDHLLVRFTLSGTDATSSNLTFTSSSTNLDLLPTNNIVFGGIGTNRTITLTPSTGQTGQVDIVVTVGDGTFSTNSTFHLSITEQVAWTIWWESTDGGLAMWQMEGTNAIEQAYLNPSKVARSWKIVGVGDFGGGGNTELLWESTDGTLGVWQMDGTNRIGAAYLNPARVDRSWRVAAAGDLSGDGSTELLWQEANGWLGKWRMAGTNSIRAEYLNPSWADPSWRIAGAGDFSGDGNTEILWQQKDGWLGMWFMQGTNRVDAAPLSLPWEPPSWKIVGTSDIDGDGRADILWQDGGGTIAYWRMDGTNCVGIGYFNPAKVDPSWKIVGIK